MGGHRSSGLPSRPHAIVLVPSAAMGPRFAIAAGLLAGVGVAAIVVIGVLVLAPDPPVASPPAASTAIASGDGPTASPGGPSSHAKRHAVRFAL